MRVVAVCVLLAVGVASFALGQAPPKKRVAVLDFDNATVQSTMMFFQTNTAALGKAVADLLVTQLVKNESCSVIERKALDKLLAEQNLSNSDRTDPLTAAKIGRVLGVDTVILGSITRYERDDKTKGGGAAASMNPFGGHSMNRKHDIKGVVQISARLVSPDTAEVLAVGQGNGEVLQKNVKVNIADQAAVYRAAGMNSNNDPLMGEALDKAVVQLAKELEQNLPKVPPRLMLIDGLVADLSSSGKLILNVGSHNGVKAGERLQVWRPGKPVRDPATGKILRYDDTLLGEAVVTGVEDISSEATYTGSETPKSGDKVKSVPKQP
jgi:curli biogenesis system outer membrane secretion channel CsgG